MICLQTRYQKGKHDGINYNTHLTEPLKKHLAGIQCQLIIEGNKKHIFRMRNIKRAIGIIEKRPHITQTQELQGIKGIGVGVLRRVNDILTTGHISLEDSTPEIESLIELSQVYGLGPKTTKRLYDLGCRSVEDLQKHQDQLTYSTRVALKYHHSTSVKIPRDIITEIDRYLSDHIPTPFQICGSYRRGVQRSGDIDVLIQRSSTMYDLGYLVQTLEEDGFLVAKLSGGDNKYNGICHFRDRYCRIDLLLTTESEYPAALLHFTGSGLFNQLIRYEANKQGYKLSNLGLSRRDTGEVIEVHSEREIFDKLGVKYLEPNERCF